jgi:hypothetical protein
MITDYFNTIADGVALSTAAPATAKFGTALNVEGDNFVDLGEGVPYYLWIAVDTTATSGGSATLALELVTADVEALTTNVEVILSTRAFPVAELVAGTVLMVVALPKGRAYRNWIGLRQVVGTAALTAGKLNAALTQDPPNWKAYPNNNQ